MLIRAVGRQLAGLEEPERRQETQSNAVKENLLLQDKETGRGVGPEATLRSVGCLDGF